MGIYNILKKWFLFPFVWQKCVLQSYNYLSSFQVKNTARGKWAAWHISQANLRQRQRRQGQSSKCKAALSLFPAQCPAHWITEPSKALEDFPLKLRLLPSLCLCKRVGPPAYEYMKSHWQGQIEDKIGKPFRNIIDEFGGNKDAKLETK